MEAVGRLLLLCGALLLFCGLALVVLSRLGLSWRPLPGDIVVQRPGFVFVFPVATMLLLSLVLTLVLNFFSWLRR